MQSIAWKTKELCNETFSSAIINLYPVEAGFWNVEVVYNSGGQDLQNFGAINSRSVAEPWVASFWMREENSPAW